MKFIQYIEPRYLFVLAIRGIFPVVFDFCSKNEFLRHEFIQKFICDPNFKKFTICRDKEYELITEFKDGRTIKIGILDGDMTEIPEWQPKKLDNSNETNHA